MKKIQANYTFTAPKFYIVNLEDNPIDSIFYELLNEIEKDFELSYPSKLSDFLKSELRDLYPFACNPVSAYDFKRITVEDFSDELNITQFIPTAIMRFQILLIELLKNNYLKFGAHWAFNVLLPSRKELEVFENITYREEMYGAVQVVGLNVLYLAIVDLHHLLNDLLPPEVILPIPTFSINQTIDAEKFVPHENILNIDFSLFNTLEDNQPINPNLIYVRTDFED